MRQILIRMHMRNDDLQGDVYQIVKNKNINVNFFQKKIFRTQ